MQAGREEGGGNTRRSQARAASTHSSQCGGQCGAIRLLRHPGSLPSPTQPAGGEDRPARLRACAPCEQSIAQTTQAKTADDRGARINGNPWKSIEIASKSRAGTPQPAVEGARSSPVSPMKCHPIRHICASIRSLNVLTQGW